MSEIAGTASFTEAENQRFAWVLQRLNEDLSRYNPRAAEFHRKFRIHMLKVFLSELSQEKQNIVLERIMWGNLLNDKRGVEGAHQA